MAELLIMARNNTHPDPVIDRDHCWKTGDVVVAMPDGHVWGDQEGLPTFYRISVPGIKPEDFRELLQQVTEEEDGKPVFKARRVKSLRLGLLPAFQRANLEAVGRITLNNWQAITNITQNRGGSRTAGR